MLQWPAGIRQVTISHVTQDRSLDHTRPAQNIPPADFFCANPGQIDGHPAARAGRIQLGAVSLEAANAPLQSGRLDINRIANGKRSPCQGAGYNRSKTGEAKYAVDRQAGTAVIRP